MAFDDKEGAKAEASRVEVEEQGLGQAQHHSLQQHTLHILPATCNYADVATTKMKIVDTQLTS